MCIIYRCTKHKVGFENSSNYRIVSQQIDTYFPSDTYFIVSVRHNLSVDVDSFG